jgi:hypothetical protein
VKGEPAGVLVFDRIGEGADGQTNVLSIVADGIFGVIAAREGGIEHLARLWRGIRRDSTELEQRTFETHFKQAATYISDYDGWKARSLAKVAWQTFLEYTQMALQAVGSAA